MAGAVTKVEATYQVPFLAHATMEPMNCTVHVRKDGCEVWVGNQALARAQAAAAKIAGLPLDKVVVHNHLIGGGFGRRLEIDGVIRAVEIAKHVDGPVKVVWTREEDIQHDMYRPMFFDRLSAGLDAKGMPVAWNNRFAGLLDHREMASARDSTTVSTPTRPKVPSIWSMPCRTCTSNMCGWSLRAFRRRSGAASGHRTMSSWSKASWTSWRRRRSRIRSPIDWPSSTRHPAPRPSSRSPRKRPAGDSRCLKGSAVASPSSSPSRPIMAQVAEVEVSKDGAVRVRRVVCAVDCGTVVNPDTVRAQIQSAVMFGITAALYGEITLKDGRVEQTNFDTYQILRMNEAPAVEVHIVQSSEPPGGMGEAGTSAIVPAVTNAIFAATGKRLRKLPIDTAALKQPV